MDNRSSGFCCPCIDLGDSRLPIYQGSCREPNAIIAKRIDDSVVAQPIHAAKFFFCFGMEACPWAFSCLWLFFPLVVTFAQYLSCLFMPWSLPSLKNKQFYLKPCCPLMDNLWLALIYSWEGNITFVSDQFCKPTHHFGHNFLSDDRRADHK